MSSPHELDQKAREKDVESLKKLCDTFQGVARPETIANLKEKVEEIKEEVVEIDRFAGESPSTK
jgi:hypothetical protein